MCMVRAGRGIENVEEFIRHGVVALGDTKLGPLSPSIKKDELLRLLAEKYPDEKAGSRASWASQVIASNVRLVLNEPGLPLVARGDQTEEIESASTVECDHCSSMSRDI